MKLESMEEYLTIMQLSDRIKMAPGTIRNLVWKKVFLQNTHYVKPTPRKILFIWSQVEEWLYQAEDQSSLVSDKRKQSNSLIHI
jgi:hypothetical protein